MWPETRIQMNSRTQPSALIIRTCFPLRFILSMYMHQGMITTNHNQKTGFRKNISKIVYRPSKTLPIPLGADLASHQAQAQIETLELSLCHLRWTDIIWAKFSRMNILRGHLTGERLRNILLCGTRYILVRTRTWDPSVSGEGVSEGHEWEASLYQIQVSGCVSSF